jgi:hypothetical protein
VASLDVLSFASGTPNPYICVFLHKDEKKINFHAINGSGNSVADKAKALLSERICKKK